MAERIEREYARATQLLDGLTDIRFKLLALVPTLSGTAVGLLRAGESAVTLLAVGVLASPQLWGSSSTSSGTRRPESSYSTGYKRSSQK